jgi:plasmid stabilization system protein ParE
VEYEVRVSPRAARELEHAIEWWRSHRDHRDLLELEIAALLRSLKSMPDRGLSWPGKNRIVRGLVTERTSYMVVYRVRPRAMRVEVISIRYAGRAR